MNESFRFDAFLGALNCSEGVFADSDSAIRDLVTHNTDISAFHISHTLVPQALAWLQTDEQGHFFTEMSLSRGLTDVMTDLRAHANTDGAAHPFRLDLSLNGILTPIDHTTKVVNTCAMYTELKIRLTFTGEPCPVHMTYRSHLLRSNLRNRLMQQHFVQDRIFYSNGVACRI